MPPAAREQLDAVARLRGEGLHDRFAEVALERALEEYRPRRREPIATVAFAVDGRPVGSLFHALTDRTFPFQELAIERQGDEGAGTRWEFLRPFRQVSVHADGTAEVSQVGGSPNRAIVRLLLREHFVPIAPPGTAALPNLPRPEPFTPPAWARYVRATGIVPFALGLAVYYPDTRVRYEVDLLDNALVLDPRTHRLPASRHVARTARTGHAVDSIVARGELSLPAARALEALVESNGLTAGEVAPLFGGVRELGASALDSLVARRLASLDRRTGVYRPRMEGLAAPSERGRGRPAATPGRSNPRLRTNVMELLAAAESRATCPLCGDPLPAGHDGLLCAKCQSLVGEPAPSRSS